MTIGRQIWLPRRRKASRIALMTLLAVGVSAPTLAQEAGFFGASGSLWSEARSSASPQRDERHDPLVESGVRESVTLLHLPGGIDIGPFVSGGLKGDANGLDYDNKESVDAGAGARLPLPDWGSVTLGARYSWERRPLSERSFAAPIGFLSWGVWHAWTPERSSRQLNILRLPSPLRYVLSGWGELRYPASAIEEERTDAMLEGAMQISVDWLQLGPQARVATFVGIGFKTDTIGLDYNNQLEPTLGVRLDITVHEGVELTFGTHLMHDWRFESGQSATSLAAFAGLATSW